MPRRLRTRTKAAVVGGALVLVAGAGIAQAGLPGGADPPPAKALDQALLAAAKAPAVPGVSARVRLTNGLLDGSGASEGHTSPLATNATGRLWATPDGRMRLELQSQAGDAQIGVDGRRVTVVDASSDTVFTGTVPEHEETAKEERARERAGEVDLADVREGLRRVQRRATLSGARPGTTAGRGSYSVRVAPKDRGGLLDSVEVAWDAGTGAPLRASVYADGVPSPVVSLEATEISYAAVDPTDLAVRRPVGARVVDLDERRSERREAEGRPEPTVQEGLAAARRGTDLDFAAPARVAGRERSAVRLISSGREDAVLIAYGTGAGRIVTVQAPVRERDAATPKGDPADRRHGDSGQVEVPTVDVGGTPARVLATPLGSGLELRRGGVSTIIAGSVDGATVGRAAAELR